MNTANTAVSWSLSAAIGVISSAGLYTAPALIASAQTVTVTATSVADPTKSASTTLSLVPDVVPPVITLTSPSSGATVSGSVVVTATASDNVAVTNVQFFVDGTSVGSSASAPYSATWNTASLPNGSHQVTATASDAAGNTASQSATVTVSNPVTAVTLPVEVVGPNGTTKAVTVNIAAPVSGAQLWMQIHNLKYETEASVQINGGAWIPINTSTVTLQGLAAAYGGIGGGFSTLKLTLPIPSGSLVAGANTVAFRFNGTDGVSSGFRVLQFNFLDSNGNQLVAATSFVQDDPNTWQAPSTLPADIAAGKVLWQTARLTAPVGGSQVSIQATCGMCHTQDGRDLKYFNYSNQSIAARSMFHGLSSVQANQIVSYIRSLNVPNPGRPWNPPYQPGPGLDSLPVSQWAAGAGINAVLDSDAAMLPYLAPDGSTAGWAATQYLNPREIPIALQLPDWNRWLPQVHPVDAFGSSFVNSAFNTMYSQIRSQLQPNNPTAYAGIDFNSWYIAGDTIFLVPIESNANWDANNLRTTVYSAVLWRAVKSWELNQEFGLEGIPQARYGTKANVRGWYGNATFNTSPNMQHIPAGIGIGNGSEIVRTYLSLIWYQTQLILNDGQGSEFGTNPLDFPYVYGFVKDLSQQSNGSPEAMLQLLWITKGLQEETLSGVGPNQGGEGWQPTWVSPEVLVDGAWLSTWSATSSTNRANLSQGYLQAWFLEIQSFTPKQFYQGSWASATDNPATLSPQTTFGGQIWYSLPRLRYYGVDPNLTYQIAAWAALIWPTGNWRLNNSATCNANLQCTSD